MKNYFLLFILSLIFCNLVNAQFTVESYPIDQFKLPDIDRQAMEFSGDFLGDYNSRSNAESGQHYTTSQFEPQVGLFYSRYINREDVQATYSISTYPDMTFQSTKNDFTDQLYSSTTFRPDLIFSSQRYKYKGNHFTSLGSLGNIFYTNQFEKQEESGVTDKVKSNNLDVLLQVPIGFGTGRLERVSDMAMALFLLNDAIKAGVDVSLISPEQVNAFASKMVSLRNERVFDTRIKRIYELRELYSFMKENGWTITDDPGFFTILTDNWLYNMGAYRLSGKRWTYEFIPEYRFSSYKSTHNDQDPYTYSFHSLGGRLRAEFEKHKPVNLHQDIIRTHAISAGVTSEYYYSEFSDRDQQVLEAGLSTSFGRQWFPNSRTTVSSTLLVNYTYYHPLNENVQLRDDDHLVNLSLLGSADYFISYRTRFFVDLSLNYNYHNNGDHILVNSNPFEIAEVNNGLHFLLNGGISVSIF